LKKILIHDYAGHPFQIDLSRELAKKYNVTHLYSGSNTTPQGRTDKNDSDLETFNIDSVKLSSTIDKSSFVKRWFQELTYGFKLLKKIRKINPELVMSANTPLDAQFIIFLYCKFRRIKFVFWLQDMITFTASNIIKRKSKILGLIINTYFGFLEKTVARLSYKTIITMDSHIDILKSWGVKDTKIELIHNWATLDDYPVIDKVNDWSLKNQYHDKFTFMWTGTMGMKHGPEFFVDLAKKYANNDNVKVVVVSESIGAKWLIKQKEKQKLHNLDILPFQPFSDVGKMMASSDCLICVVSNDVADAAIPSKFLSYMCSKRGIILSIKDDNQAALIAKKYNTALVCNPDDSNQFLKCCDVILNDSKLRNTLSVNARKYAETTFNLSNISQKFIKFIK
tara:strand:- start:942 stop:2126 length:1185 start_codon:yes stop_codon:yes gene_type:complete